jgi:hypothetical protein
MDWSVGLCYTDRKRHHNRQLRPRSTHGILTARSKGFCRETYGFEHVLIRPLVAQWLQILPIKCRLAHSRAAAEDDELEGMPT